MENKVTYHSIVGLFGYEKLITNCEPVKDTTLYDLMKKQAKEEKVYILFIFISLLLL